MSKTTVYELAILYRSSSEESLNQVVTKVKELITSNGGKIVAEDDWGKRQLAYKIKQQAQAIYVFYDIEIDGLSLVKIEAALNINEDILRYQFHKPDFKAREATTARRTDKAATSAEASKEKPEPKQEQAEEVKVKQDVA